MAFGVNTPWLTRLIALALAGIALVLAAGPGADAATAASPCAKYGDVKTKKLGGKAARAAIRCLINKERQNRGLSKLDKSKKLQKAAQKHNDYMVKKNCFAHQCSGEASLESRLRGVSYLLGGLLRWTFGENIAYGGGHYGTPKSIMNAWMNSAGHRANILNPAFRDVGVGFTPRAPGGGGDAGTYTTDFGMRIG